MKTTITILGCLCFVGMLAIFDLSTSNRRLKQERELYASREDSLLGELGECRGKLKQLGK